MALEAVVFPQSLVGHPCNEFYTLGEGGLWNWVEEEKGVMPKCEVGVGGSDSGSWDQSCCSWDVNASPQTQAGMEPRRRKRPRATRCKNKEEVESQRMTHIAVERNRRKQMNEYLTVLQSLMPPFYVQRSDQASIVGGAINYVKELEQLIQSLEAQKQIKLNHSNTSGLSSIFADFFAFPQFSSRSFNSSTTTNRPVMAELEVTMAESHANLKVLLRRRPKQLLKLVEGLQNLGLTTLHLNVTTVEHMVMYSFSLKVEDAGQCPSADEIATIVYQMLMRIQEDAVN